MIAAPVPLMLEAAMRALLAAIAVWVSLRLLGVRNVLVQKSAWGLVLIAALAMPLVPHWQGLSALAALRLPALPRTSTAQPLPVQPQKSVAAIAAPRASSAIPPRESSSIARRTQAPPRRVPATPQSKAPKSIPAAADRSRGPENSISKSYLPANSTPEPAIYTNQPVPTLSSAGLHSDRTALLVAASAWLLYIGVLTALLLRLLFGLTSALKLWMSANPICTLDKSGTANSMAVRSSARVASPVNVGSGIILPVDFREWGRSCGLFWRMRGHMCARGTSICSFLQAYMPPFSGLVRWDGG